MELIPFDTKGVIPPAFMRFLSQGSDRNSAIAEAYKRGYQAALTGYVPGHIDLLEEAHRLYDSDKLRFGTRYFRVSEAGNILPAEG